MLETRKEVEIKLAVADLSGARKALARLGARPVAVGGAGKARAGPGRRHEFNTLFDTPDGGLAKHGQLLRIRTETGEGRGAGRAKEARTVLTYKGPSVADSEASAALGRRYKVREEHEVGVADGDHLRQILEALGLRGWFRYEKYRTTFGLPAKHRWAAGLRIELDETPIGAFFELEGPPEAIDRAAELLGYRAGDYITKSYLAIHLEQCRRQGQTAGDLLFPPKSRGKRGEKSLEKGQSFLDKPSGTV
jgi:adenylate cyclase class 2